VIVTAPDGRVASANARAELLLNLSERAMRGQPLPAGIPSARGAGGEADYTAYDVEIDTAHGGRLRVDLFETGMADHPGWRVVTLHPAAGARGIGQAERGAGARAAIGAAAMLAHEIKNPLSGIRGAAQLLDAGELSDLIIAEVDRVAALIDRMEAFGDQRPLPLSPENIYPLLARSSILAEAGFARGVRIEERFDPSLPRALVNRDALVQVLINLLKNASEAVAGVADPAIVVATAYRYGVTRAAGPGQLRVPLPIEIAVIDNGPGAPADIAEHLFEPFVSGKPEGRGLGLALVDKLVRDMGGIVRFARTGEPAQTIVSVLLPRGAP